MMNEANKSTGGLRKIASCYAILGTVLFGLLWASD